MPKDETGLSWAGATKPEAVGGFVGDVGLNRSTKNALAVDPDGVVMPTIRSSERAGPSLELERMDSADAHRSAVTRAGRVRLTRD